MTTIGYGDITPATLCKDNCLNELIFNLRFFFCYPDEKAFMIFVALLATNVFAYSFS